jgi:hypothetical protein
MELKQSQQKYLANIEEVAKRMLPAVLAATENNGRLIGSWLAKHCVEAEGDIVDGSTANILRAVDALDKAGLLDWQVAPVKKPAKKRPDVLQSRDGSPINHAKPDRVSDLDRTMAEEKRRREALGDAANREIMAEAISLVKNHSSVSHSRTYRERATLKSEFDRLVAAGTHPTELLVALKIKQDTFANGDVTRPRFGSR